MSASKISDSAGHFLTYVAGNGLTPMYERLVPPSQRGIDNVSTYKSAARMARKLRELAQEIDRIAGIALVDEVQAGMQAGAIDWSKVSEMLHALDSEEA